MDPVHSTNFPTNFIILTTLIRKRLNHTNNLKTEKFYLANDIVYFLVL